MPSIALPSARTWRRITVWLHILTSVGWMSLAAVLAVALTFAAGTDDHELRRGVLAAVHHLDGVLLAPLAVGSALTGITLAAATPYGFFHHWWVTVKFAITVVQLYVGIFVLSGILNAAAADPASVSGPLIALPAALMAAAIAFQAWLSVDKPWGRTRWAPRRPKPQAGPRWMFAAACAAVVTDLVVGYVSGGPRPLASIVVLVAVLVGRPRQKRTTGSPRTTGSRPDSDAGTRVVPG